MAKRQHQPLAKCFLQEPFYSRLLQIIPQGTMSLLLTSLLNSDGPVRGEVVAKRAGRKEGAIWSAARKLNKYLEEFSHSLGTLKSAGVEIQIPLGPRGGHNFGYYLACFDSATQKYLDGPQTVSLLQAIVNTTPKSEKIGIFDHLLTVEEVLETNRPPDPQWFRPAGLFFCDFEHRKFYRRAEVDTLKQKILAKPLFFLLHGDAATAKTAIVRTLMYELYKAGNSKVYYFDISTQRHFNEVQLARDIRSVSGLVIIENIHLESQKVQWLYDRFKNDHSRYFLLTSRLSSKELPGSKSMDFDDTNTMSLNPFEDAEQLIKEYCSDSEIPPIVWKKHQDIINVSRKDFWLLALTARGCADAEGQGEPLSWIGGAVKKQLADWGFCRDQCAGQYAGILVALSPLYKTEVMTAETYLKKLGFTKDALNGLVERGEVTIELGLSQEFLYGLPHSSLANAYWEHGKGYITQRKLKVYEEFIYDYAVSGVPNGMQAVVSTQKEVEARILRRLDADSKIILVAEREQSVPAIVQGVIWSDNITRFNTASSSFLNTLAKKSVASHDVSMSGWCFREIYKVDNFAGQKFFGYLIHHSLPTHLSRSDNAWYTACCLDFMHEVHPETARELCRRLNSVELAYKFNHEEDVGSVCIGVHVVFTVNEGKAWEIWNSLDLKRLGAKLSSGPDPLDRCMGIYWIFKSSTAIGEQLSKFINASELAAGLVQCKHIGELFMCIGFISMANSHLREELKQHLDYEDIVTKCMRSGDIAGMTLMSTLYLYAKRGEWAMPQEIMEAERAREADLSREIRRMYAQMDREDHDENT